MRDEAELRDFLSEAEIAALAKPAGQARGLPGRAYAPDFFALEQRLLFPRTWCAVAFAGDVPRPGDVRPVNLAGWPLVLVRGTDGTLRCFLNICRHRAMRVVMEPASGRRALSCPWHGWTYGLDGKLQATPRVGGERVNDDPRLCRDGADLRPVRIAQWLDLVFVNIEDNAPPFAEHIRPLETLLSDYDLADLARGEEWSLDYPGNWKLATEGAIEDYHLPWGHPQLLRGQRSQNPRSDAAPGCFFSVSSAFAAAQARAHEPPRIVRAGADGLERSFFIILFPTGSVWTRPNQVMLGLWLPDGADNTRLRYVHYYPSRVAADPAFAEMRRADAATFHEVLAQDVPFVRHVHGNAQWIDQAGFRPRFSPFWEENLPLFQRSVVDALRP